MCWQTYCCHCSLTLSQLGGCRQRTAGVAWEELQGKASPPPPTLSPTLTLLLPHHLQTKSRHGTPLTLRGSRELFVLGYLSRVCYLGGKYVGLYREGESLTPAFTGSLAGALIDLPVGTQQVASEVKKKRQKERKGSNNLWITATMEREGQQNNASLSHSPLQQVATSKMGGVGPQRIRSRSLSSGERKE